MNIEQLKKRILCLPIIVLIMFAFAQMTAMAQTTAFNFQGRLNDGSSPANGRYDLEFRLYDAITGGNQIGSTVSKPNVMLVNGVFSTSLDFGLNAFSGADRFIEISLRQTVGTNIAPNAFVILGPRQQILSVPYGIRSLHATLADDATHAVQADNAANATVAQSAVTSQQLGGVAAARFVQQDANGNVTVTGSIIQPLNSKGLPKAIAHLDRDGNITDCYNGITGASTNGCGFSATHPSLGSYEIRFNSLQVNSAPVIITTEYDSNDTVGTLVRRGGFIEIRVHYISNGDLTNSALSVVIF